MFTVSGSTRSQWKREYTVVFPTMRVVFVNLVFKRLSHTYPAIIPTFRLDHPNIMALDLQLKNPKDPALPPPLTAAFKDSYAYKTVQTRMPVILTKIVDHLSRHKSEVYEADPPGNQGSHSANHAAHEAWNAHRHEVEEELKQILGALAKLRNELQTNKAITLFPDTESTSSATTRKTADNDIVAGLTVVGSEDLAEWNAAYSTSLAQNLVNPDDKPKWFDSAWLYVEPYMYRRIMWAIHQTKHLRNLDPFKWQKADSVKDNTENIHGILDYLNTTLENVADLEGKFSAEVQKNFQNLLRLSLWGNKGDLSHSAGQEKSETPSHDPHEEQKKMQDTLVVDESDAIWQHVVQINSKASSPIRIDIICDNYGLELITDLVLGEFLLVSGLASQVQYHVKAMPWFVSDTTVPDFYRTLLLIQDHDGKFAEKWAGYLQNGKFVVRTDPFWTLPYDFDWMPKKAEKLYKDLKESSLLIFKGDLNYRKLVGDLAWSPTTPFKTALRGFVPGPLCTLRGLKAETVVGLREGLAEEMARLADDWMSSGNFAVIQFRGLDKPS